ncbi:hypothetical protein [Blautia producta]|uniref:hypothetical protein n=1 Tax=Blautia producta TaxID=33035 RepID=UPI0031B63468
MSSKPKRYYREPQAASKLEVGMLEYSLKEAREKLERKTEELERVTAILEQTTKVSDQRAEKISNFSSMSATITKRMVRWKLAAIVEAVVMLTYILLQGVA